MNNQLVVIGAGPAGLSAAIEAARYGVKVLVIDENDRPGGQLFLQTHRFFGSHKHRAGVRGFQIGYDLLRLTEKYNVGMLLNTVVWGIYPDMRVAYTSEEKKKDYIFAKNILITTGALEKALYFKGWTKPGIMGAGAAQYMMNINRVLPGKKVLMVGTGNVGLIVSYQMIQAGAEIVGVIDALSKVGGYQVHADKIRRLGVPILTSHTIVEARGNPNVESAVITRVGKDGNIIKGTEIEAACDLICLAVGLRPFNELCWAANLKMKYIKDLGGFIPVHNIDLETLKSGVYVAGDVCGTEEANTAMDEGRLVGVVVAQKLGYIEGGEARKIKDEIKNRLEDLRIGSYGEMRAIGKREILKYYSNGVI